MDCIFLLAAKAAPISRNVRSLVSQSVSQSVSQLVNKLKKHSKAWLKLSTHLARGSPNVKKKQK